MPMMPLGDQVPSPPPSSLVRTERESHSCSYVLGDSSATAEACTPFVTENLTADAGRDYSIIRGYVRLGAGLMFAALR